MRRFITLKTIFFSILLALAIILGYSVVRLYDAYMNDILTQYVKMIRSESIELRFDIETALNQASDYTNAKLSNDLTKFVNTHPVIERVQVFMEGELLADSDVAHTPVSGQVLKRCLSIKRLSTRSLKEGYFCYDIPLHVYTGELKRDAHLLIYLDARLLGQRIKQEIRKILIPIMGVLFLMIMVTAAMVWFAVIRGFIQLSRWSENPLQQPPRFITVDFRRIAEVIHHYALTTHTQIEKLESAAKRENYLRSIMQTVAKINELMIQVTEERSFLQKAVTTLTGHQNYASAKILLKAGEMLQDAAEAVEEGSACHKICLDLELFRRADQSLNGYLEIEASSCLQCRSSAICLRYPGTTSEQKHIVIIPLRFDVKSDPIGYLCVISRNLEGFYPEEVDMLKELAGDIGFAINAIRKERDLQRQLYTDALTRLPNLSAFMRDSERHVNRVIAILNIDRFRQINDLYGINVADAFLTQLARYLEHNLPEGVVLYHYIGDEFILLFPKEINRYEIEKMLEKLEARIETHLFTYDDVDILFSVRFGVTLYRDESSLRECQIALKEAKKLQRSIVWYSPSYEELVHKEAIHTYRDIKEALHDNRILTHYQGIYKFETEDFSHFESLIRMKRPDGSFASPIEFIDVAKQTRLYPEMTLRMVLNAVEAIQKLDRSVSVNLSIIDILNEELIRNIYAILEANSLPHPLVFEILESENIENYKVATAFVNRVKEYGCKIAIDDFGSGYANFHYIAKLNADILKIDGSLIKEMPHDPQSRTIVKNIDTFAKDLGMMTIAEFVSDATIDRIVREIGIDAAQGFFYHKPAPLEEIVKKG